MAAVAGKPVEERPDAVEAGRGPGSDRPIMLEEPASEGEAFGRRTLEAAERLLEGTPRRLDVLCKARRLRQGEKDKRQGQEC